MPRAAPAFQQPWLCPRYGRSALGGGRRIGPRCLHGSSCPIMRRATSVLYPRTCSGTCSPTLSLVGDFTRVTLLFYQFTELIRPVLTYWLLYRNLRAPSRRSFPGSPHSHNPLDSKFDCYRHTVVHRARCEGLGALAKHSPIFTVIIRPASFCKDLAAGCALEAVEPHPKRH